MPGDPAQTALVAATAAHLGFQLTVTVVVYPALGRAENWDAAHTAHSRAITPVVALVYGALVAAVAWSLLAAAGLWTGVAAVGAGLSVLVTATVAAPTHGRLSGGWDPVLFRRLLRADVLRSFGAVVALLGALLTVAA